MNITLALLEARRSVPPHLLTGPGPSQDELDRLLTIAARVPDHGKLAPWRFLVIAEDARTRIGDLIATAFQVDEPAASPDRVELERGRLARAPLVVGVVSRAQPHAKIPEWEQVMSAGAATTSLIFAAHALRYAANWLTEWYAYDRQVLDALGLKADERIAGFVHIGRTEKPAEDRPRPPLAAIVTRFHAG